MNRIDEAILFQPLTKKNVEEIVKIQLSSLKSSLLEKGIDFNYTIEAISHIVETGYDPFFGARPIKRVIQKEVLNELSKALISNTIDKLHPVVMDVFEGQMVFRKPINDDSIV